MQSSIPYAESNSTEESLLEFCITYNGTTLEESMSNACESLLYKASLNGSTKLEKLLEICNCRVIEKSISTTGRLEIDDTGFVIYLYEKMPNSRKRFTIAHELAHILVIQGIYHKPHLLKSLRQPNIWAQIEKLCDEAAVFILIPKNQFIEKIKECGLSSKGINDVCKYFEISRESFFIRFKNIFRPSTIALCKSQKYTQKITPSIVRIRNSLYPKILREGEIGINDLDYNLIRTAVKKGYSWSNSLIVKINNKNTRIFRMAILNPTSVHYKNKFNSTLDGVNYIHEDKSDYDVILFYLPLELIHSDDLIQAIQNG